MLKIEHVKTYGWDAAIRGMRNPMNSWDRSDSISESYTWDDILSNPEYADRDEIVGPNDRELMKKLIKGGPVHAKFRRMLTITMDITAPLYWWKEFDTYKVGTVANSCSTMHKIADKEFTIEDFSVEHLMHDIWDGDEIEECAIFVQDLFDIPGDVLDGMIQEDGSTINGLWASPKKLMRGVVEMLNEARTAYLATGNKQYWWQMIQLLPTSYNQRRTVQLNYETAAQIFKSRANHKLTEWAQFRLELVKLPESWIITEEDI